jgi:virulence factor Mce-like protein
VSEFLRNSINLVIFGILTLVLLVYFGTTIARDIFLDDRYPVTLTLPDSGGLVEDHFVTVMGKDVGRIEEMRLTEDGQVEFELRIRPQQRVPSHAIVHVLRRSAIGEHTINLIPIEEGWQPEENGRLVVRFVEPAEGWQAAEPGDEIQPEELIMPVPTADVLAGMRDLFEAIPKDDLNLLIHEIADAVGGRGEVLVDLARQSHDLYETFVPAIPDFDRQLTASRPILEAVRDSRDDVAAMFTHVADLSELLADARPTMEALVDDSRRMTTELDALIRPQRPNLTCLIRDLRDYQRVNVDNLDWITQSLDYNVYFWDGNAFGRQYDPWRPNTLWLRSGTLAMAESTGEAYDSPRPTPATRPAAACETDEFGPGVQAVRQPDHQPAHPTSPGIEWAPLVEGAHTGAPEPVAAAADDGDDTAVAAGRWPDADTPETGGGAALALLGPALLLAAFLLRRRLRDGS